ncbi:TPA: polysaccharide deacetylase family protein [Acinetobacter baumannii]|uniref:Polysaccharide deacetylase family protein n=2 Tax=Acinetobacter baumannii TaxID=470 RepID=A0A9P2P7C0_ACIBA|nr:polysaccharide deacetylase family protein [Acinetobacter baumannii]EKT7958058.1 polysaccharide deacetylase family protein [Acinetobacter baumannii]EKT9124247.1 polysaccharide deacetylase family protein [Acinetobacter baumannii]EKT9273573.1 polysaccharide deacetylase family protein [Acinetobacter baumannii]EKT9314369.1 polysaccharide deacetylase family protein [Acinetobacter baumannii]EKU0108786.1 polysaccharide deacetylase family protein [Acinetobacter baumannii]
MIYLFLVLFVMVGLFSYKFAWWKPAIDWKRPRVLMYHMVREHIDGAKFNKLRVTPEQFEHQVAWMSAQGFHFVTMQELQENWGKHPEKTVAITFDDGYLDNLENAYPVLEKYQAKATIYVVVDRHNRDWSTYKKAHHNSGELAREPKLNDEQVRFLANSGLVEIGSHTMTHANLDKLTDDECLQELVQSKQQLEQIIGQPVTSFAYPFGIYSQRDVELTKQAGYHNAVTTKKGIDTAQPDFMQLKRIKISGKDSMLAVKCRLKLGQRGL